MILPSLPEVVIDGDGGNTTVVAVYDGDVFDSTPSTGDVVTTSSNCGSSSVIVPEVKVLGSDEWWMEFWGDRWLLVVLIMFSLWFMLEFIKILRGMYVIKRTKYILIKY